LHDVQRAAGDEQHKGDSTVLEDDGRRANAEPIAAYDTAGNYNATDTAAPASKPFPMGLVAGIGGRRPVILLLIVGVRLFCSSRRETRQDDFQSTRFELPPVKGKYKKSGSTSTKARPRFCEMGGCSAAQLRSIWMQIWVKKCYLSPCIVKGF